MWQESFSQPDPEWRQTEADAAALVQQAASADPQWQPLLDTMNQLLALSEQADTDSTREQGRALNATLSEQCAPTGVTVKSA